MGQHHSQGFCWGKRIQPFLLPLLLGLVATIAVLGLWQQLVVEKHLHTEQLVLQQVNTIRAELEKALTAHVSTLERMARRWNVAGGTSKNVWEIAAVSNVEDFPGLQAIAWVDASFQVQWVVPANNDEFQTLNLHQIPDYQSTLKQARNLRQPLFTPTVLLPNGEKGFLAIAPLFVKLQFGDAARDRFDGFILGLLSSQPLFDSTLPPTSQYQVQISDDTGLIYQQGEMLPSTPATAISFQACGREWHVRVALASLIHEYEYQSSLPTIVLRGGLVGAWALALLVYLGQQAKHQSRQTRIINQQLQHEIRHRQQVEANLRQSEERWQLALRGNNDGIWDWDVRTNEVFFSSRWKEMLGFEDHEIANHLDEWSKRVHPDDLVWVTQLIQGHFAGKTPFYISEHRVQCKDGSYKWILDRGQALWDEAGHVIRMTGSHTDITDRKRTEEALRQSESTLRSFFNSGAMLMGIVELHEHDILHLSDNQTTANFFGMTPEAMHNCFASEMGVSQTQLKRWMQAYQQAERTQSPVAFEYPHETPSGLRWLAATVCQIDNQSNHYPRFSYIIEDITNRKQIELALAAELMRSQLLFNTSIDGIVILDYQGNVIQTSASFAQMLGYTVEETLTLNVVDWDAQWSAEELHQILQRTVSLSGLFETRHRRKDGSIYDVEISYNRVELNGEMMHFCICRDISERVRLEADRQQAEEDLVHQKEMFKAIVDNIPVMIALFDQQGQIEFVNPELENTLGWTLADWQHQDTFALCYPDAMYRQTVANFMLAATGKWQDLMTLTASGQLLETSWANVRLSSGQFLGIGQDISDRKRKESALQQAMEAAEAANLAKSMFLANMSHELRTPLNVILGFTQVMFHDSSLTSAQLEDLQTIQRSSDHLLSLINDILDLSKIEAGHFTLQESGFDLISLLHTLRTMMAERAKVKQLQLTFDIAPTVPQFVICDEQKLRQILLNLLSNAIKFTKQGRVTLRVTSWESSSPKIYLDPNTSIPDDVLKRLFAKASCTLQFEVADTGVGIGIAEREVIFDAFMQAEAGRKSMVGTGLGLTISRKLLELMDGSISVESTPGVGSTFTVMVPACPASGVDGGVARQERTIIGLVPGQFPHRILVVDDQRENRLLMVRLLTHLGLEVQEATNGREAIALWQQWKPDLTWMDIRMPGLDGYEATKQIRAMEQGQASIIIALTAQASQSDRTLALAAGCNDYISKPFREETLFLKLKEYLGLEYLYAETLDLSNASPVAIPHTTVDHLSASDLKMLTQVSAEWLETLEDLALCGNDRAIADLANQLPPELETLKMQLLNLANRFDFEQIVDLIHRDSSP